MQFIVITFHWFLVKIREDIQEQLEQGIMHVVSASITFFIRCYRCALESFVFATTSLHGKWSEPRVVLECSDNITLALLMLVVR